MVGNNNLKALHKSLLKENYDVPADYATFEKDLQKEDNSRALFTSLSKEGYDVPADYDSFASTLSLPKKKVETYSADLSATGSVSSPAPKIGIKSGEELKQAGLDMAKAFNAKQPDNEVTPEKAQAFKDVISASQQYKKALSTGPSEGPTQAKADQEKAAKDYQSAIDKLHEVNGQPTKIETEQAVRDFVEGKKGVDTKSFADDPGAYINNFAGHFNQAVVSSAASVPKTIGILASKIDKTLGVRDEDASKYGTYQIGNFIEKKALDWGITATDPSKDNFITSDVANGLGSVMAIMLSGGRSALAGETAGLTATQLSQRKAMLEGIKDTGKLLAKPGSVVGSTSMAVPEFEAAKKAGISDDEALGVFAKNYFVGTTEILPIQNALDRINKASGGHIVQIVKNGLTGGIEEGIQETVQQTLTNKIAQGTYDPKRDLFQDVIRSGAAGFFVGALLPGIAGAMQHMTPEQKTETQQILHDTFKEYQLSKQQANGEENKNQPESSVSSEANIAQVSEQGPDKTVSTPAPTATTTTVEPYEVKPVVGTAKGKNFDYTPNKDLTPEQTAVEDKFAKDLDENYQAKKEEYTKKFGNVIDADNARTLSPDYVSDPEKNSIAVHRPASSFLLQLYKDKLAEPAPKGKKNLVVFIGGGAGAGKSSLNVGNSSKAQIVQNTNMAPYQVSKNQINRALNAGKDVEVNYIYRDPVKSFEDGVVPRAIKTGRAISIKEFIRTHLDSLSTIKKLQKDYDGDSKVKINVYDNTKGKGEEKISSFEKLNVKDYTPEQLSSELNGVADKLLSEGKISQELYNQFTERGGTDLNQQPPAPTTPSPGTGKYGQVNDPNELARMYHEEVRNPSIDPKDRAIADVLARNKVNEKSMLETVADAANFNNSIARSYLSRKGGTKIDQIAQDVSHTINPKGDGTEVSPEDIWNFMKKYHNGALDIYRPAGNPNLTDINERYKALTGNALNKRTARLMVEKTFSNDAAKETLENNPSLQDSANFLHALDSIEKHGITTENIDDPAISELLTNTLEFGPEDKQNIQFILQYGKTEEGRKKLTELRDALHRESYIGTSEGSGLPEVQSQPGEGTAKKLKQKKRTTLKGIQNKISDLKSQIQNSPEHIKIEGKKATILTEEGGKIIAKYTKLYQRYKALMNKRYQGEQASTEKFYEPPMGSPVRRGKPKHARISPSPIYGANVKLLKDILMDFSKSIKNAVYYTKSPIKGRRAIASYNSSNAAIAIKFKGDLDATAHELGHALDDNFKLLETIPANQQNDIEKELRLLSVYGSKPPKGHPSPKSYRMREGIAEYVRAYLVNPDAARTTYPAMTKYFIEAVPTNVIDDINKFGTDIRGYVGLSYHDKIMSNVDFEPNKKKGTLSSFLKPTSAVKENFRITWKDRLANKLVNDKHYFDKAVKFLQEQQGITDLQPENDPTLLSRVLLGSNEKMDNIFEKGLVNIRNERVMDSVTGSPMSFEWLFRPFENSSQATIIKEQQEAISYMVALRTLELSKRFGREALLTGIGAGVYSDATIAKGRVEEFEQYPIEKQERITEAIRRYREYADRNLRYLVDSGRMSQEQYDQIKKDNTEYVALARVLEAGPEDEIVVYNKPGSGNASIASPKNVINKIKGSSALINNPYEALIENTVKIVNEGDRNRTMLAFKALFEGGRNMSQGNPQQLGQIARPATSKDKNTVKIYDNGKLEYWQLDDDVYASVKNITDVTKTLPMLLTAVPKVLRWSVTHFPVFAVRNRIRDIQHRMIISNTKAFSGYDIYTDKKTKELNKDLFQLFGGGQSGFYMMNDNFYYKKMSETIKDIATEKNTILISPTELVSKFGTNYLKLLSSGERATRLEEYRSSFKEGKRKGMDDYNASLYAAYQSRDLLDFAVAGSWMRLVNQLVPFSNAAVQGLVKTVKSAQSNPGGFTIRFAINAVLPAILLRMMVSYMGKDEEYENFPAYRRDLYYNIPLGPDLWLTIPKPFELGVLSSGVERSVSKYALGQDKALEGYAGSLAKTVMPLDEAALAGGYKPIIEVLTNYDFFRDKNIIPPEDVALDLELRDTGKASRLGKGIQEVVGVDARQIDYLIKGMGSYFGNTALQLSDAGREDTRYPFNWAITGLLKGDPLYDSKDVQFVMDFVKHRGIHWSDPLYMELNQVISTYYEAESPEERSEIAKTAREMARDIREVYESNEYYTKENQTIDDTEE